MIKVFIRHTKIDFAKEKVGEPPKITEGEEFWNENEILDLNATLTWVKHDSQVCLRIILLNKTVFIEKSHSSLNKLLKLRAELKGSEPHHWQDPYTLEYCRRKHDRADEFYNW